MRRLIAALALLMVGAPTQAYDGWSSGRILSIRIQSYRILVVQQNATNPGGCSDASYLVLPQSDSIYHKNMYAALLTAYAAQTPVKLALTGCSEGLPAIEQVFLTY